MAEKDQGLARFASLKNVEVQSARRSAVDLILGYSFREWQWWERHFAGLKVLVHLVCSLHQDVVSLCRSVNSKTNGMYAF
jgi:hypothetical protein